MRENLSNEAVLHVQKEDGTEYIQFRKLLEYPTITHGFTLKGTGNNYYAEQGQNYAQLCHWLGIKRENLVRIAHQVHSNLIEEVENARQEPTQIDGLITKQPEIALALRFADCTPIFLYDPVQNAIGNIHSGWRGTVQKIAQKGVEQMMEKYHTRPEDLICCIGPCIQACHFEVEEDTKNQFEQTFAQDRKVWEQALRVGEVKEGKQKYWIDTTLLNIEMLAKMGVQRKNIINSGICTVCHKEQIHSYRAEGSASGRNMSVIAIKEKGKEAKYETTTNEIKKRR